ncbi:hypothetical protein CWT12_12400 [Actinomyces sp. 432]|uniref:hypothetical protein n=1 Tax=Actinomyces sp. 432 TaxID=2057798 RepID=UPI001373D9E1|nr:hypothetical protein [Actinomyces sp. 432]QHO91952.1 hypothetical protein CWT12_12400 [Actinomyces sp. 432]
MSASQTFAYCHDCRELNYGIPDRNGVYTRDSAASNHWDHHVTVLSEPERHAPPIRLALIKLQAGAEITDTEAALAALAIQAGGLNRPAHNGDGDGERTARKVDAVARLLAHPAPAATRCPSCGTRHASQSLTGGQCWRTRLAHAWRRNHTTVPADDGGLLDLLTEETQP